VLTIRNLVKKLNADGLTIFLTTHNMEEANQMCDRVAIINKGKIAAIDTPEKLKRTIKKLQSIEISFVDSTKDLIPELETIQGVTEVVKHGDKYHLNTDSPPKTLSEIWRYASENNLKLNTVNTLGPSLEDVFVSLTGITPDTKSNNKSKSGSGSN
jgi:ABC-2 type transport system ATP-binding protein